MSTKDRILQQAIKMINNKGLRDVGVRDIARALEISPGNMSYHFPRKDDLVIALLNSYSERNSMLYDAYSEGVPSLSRFLDFFRGLFNNQYGHRGVFVGQEEVSRIMKENSSFNYTELEQKRKRALANMIRELGAAGELKVTEEDVKFLVDFLSLFGRFWIMEAFISDRNQKKGEVIEHYLRLLEKQLTLFVE